MPHLHDFPFHRETSISVSYTHLDVYKRQHIESQLGLGVDKHRPINIEKACQILNQTKNGINKMVRSRTIPHYIQGNKVYFFEDELIKWVEKERVATLQEKYTSKRNY